MVPTLNRLLTPDFTRLKLKFVRIGVKRCSRMCVGYILRQPAGMGGLVAQSLDLAHGTVVRTGGSDCSPS